MNWIIGIQWSKFPGSDCSSLTIGSKRNELLSQLCSHSPELSPKSQWKSHILSAMTVVFLLRKLQTIRSTFLSCEHLPPSQSFILSFSLPHASKRQAVLLEGCPFTWLLILWDFAGSVFCFFHHHQFPYTDARNHGCLRSYLTGTNTRCLPFFTSLKAGVTFLIHGFLTNTYKYSFSSTSKRKHRCPVSYKKSLFDTVINPIIIWFLSFYTLQTFKTSCLSPLSLLDYYPLVSPTPNPLQGSLYKNFPLEDHLTHFSL